MVVSVFAALVVVSSTAAGAGAVAGTVVVVVALPHAPNTNAVATAMSARLRLIGTSMHPNWLGVSDESPPTFRNETLCPTLVGCFKDCCSIVASARSSSPVPGSE